jgi:hypothetical protein
MPKDSKSRCQRPNDQDLRLRPRPLAPGNTGTGDMQIEGNLRSLLQFSMKGDAALLNQKIVSVVTNFQQN